MRDILMAPKRKKINGQPDVSCRLPAASGLQPTHRTNRGVTLIELMVAMSVFALLCTMTTSNMLSWRNEARMNDAAMKVLSVYQNARVLAVKENATVLVSVDSAENSYMVFIDNGVGNHRGNRNPDGDETVQRGAMPPGIYVDGVTRKTVGFDSRGIPYFGTTVTLTDRGGRQKRVVVSPSGHSRIERDR